MHALHEAFHYDPGTGVVTRKYSAGNVKAGSPCGRPDSKGYLRVFFRGKDHKIHRLAWYLHYGEWPKTQLDHRDGDKTNNRISNLRECNTSINCANQHGPRKNNRLGIQGVHYVSSIDKYRATFRGKGLGCFSTPEEAQEAYLQAKQEYTK